MKRREFVHVTGMGILGSTLTGDIVKNERRNRQMLNAEDIQTFLRSLCTVDEPSVDRVVVGDPGTVVTKIGTAWMPYWDTIRDAAANGINTMVVHEPTFYTHWDLDRPTGDYYNAPEAAKTAYLDLVQQKKEWIEAHELVIIRSHDVPDKIADFGMPYALGKALGFSNEDVIRARTYYNVYRVEPQPAIELARKMAAQLKSLGQPGVAFYGEAQRVVRSAGVGTGYISNPMQFADMEPDLFVTINDCINTWTEGVFAADSGYPLVVIDHGTSEEFGMRLLNDRLKAAFPDHEVVHFEQGCSFRWIQ